MFDFIFTKPINVRFYILFGLNVIREVYTGLFAGLLQVITVLSLSVKIDKITVSNVFSSRGGDIYTL